MVLADVPLHPKSEPGYIRTFPRYQKPNEGTFGCSLVPKTPERGHIPIFAKTRPFVSSRVLGISDFSTFPMKMCFPQNPGNTTKLGFREGMGTQRPINLICLTPEVLSVFQTYTAKTAKTLHLFVAPQACFLFGPTKAHMLL